MSQNLIKTLDHAMPANARAAVGTLLEEIINKLNTAYNKATKFSLGSPAAVSANALISAATSTELPNNATKTYTTATDNVSPLDGAIAAPASLLMSDGQQHLVWSLDASRNLTAAVTHATSVVAMTILISGFDLNKNPLSELLTIAATGTSQAAAGKKAFKYIESYAIVSAGDATTNTLNVGFGDVLGLPYVLGEKSDLLQTWFNQVVEATVPTVVVADTGTVSTTSGDPRGTIDLNSASNGSSVRVWMNAGSDYLLANNVVPLSQR